MSENTRVIAAEEDRALPVPLTEAERDEYARQLASEVEMLANLDDEKKVWNSAFGKRRKTQNDLVMSLTNKVNTMQEDRLTRCDVMHDYRARKVEVVRRDTLETVETRPMTRAEYERGTQMEL